MTEPGRGIGEHKLRWALAQIAKLGDAQGGEAINLARWALGKPMGMVTKRRLDRLYDETFRVAA